MNPNSFDPAKRYSFLPPAPTEDDPGPNYVVPLHNLVHSPQADWPSPRTQGLVVWSWVEYPSKDADGRQMTPPPYYPAGLIQRPRLYYPPPSHAPVMTPTPTSGGFSLADNSDNFSPATHYQASSVAPASGTPLDDVALAQENSAPQRAANNLRNLNLESFVLNLQVYCLLDKKCPHKKVSWKLNKKPMVRLPAGTNLVNIDLCGFQKLLAGLCMQGNESMGTTIMGYERKGLLTWCFHVNGARNFLQGSDVEVTTDAHFVEWLEAWMNAGNRPVGVRVTMPCPVEKDDEDKVATAMMRSIKRSNKELANSSDEAADNEKDAYEEEVSEVDDTLDNDADQRLHNVIYTIRQKLTEGSVKGGETPMLINPKNAQQRLTMTPELIKIWAQDCIQGVPGVDTDHAPMRRPEFRFGHKQKRPFEDSFASQETHHPRGSLGPQSSSVSQAALALSVDMPLLDFLHFANIRNEETLAVTMAELDSLGIDHWSVFLVPGCLEMMDDRKELYGRNQKLRIAAPAYESHLDNIARGRMDSQ